MQDFTLRLAGTESDHLMSETLVPVGGPSFDKRRLHIAPSRLEYYSIECLMLVPDIKRAASIRAPGGNQALVSLE